MPRYLRRFKEIKRGVILQYEGLDCVSIAKKLTEENLDDLRAKNKIDAKVLTELNRINENRKSSTSIRSLLQEMKTYLPDGFEIENLSDKIVHPKRIQALAKTDLWQEFAQEFDKEHTKLLAKAAASEIFKERESQKNRKEKECGF